MLSLRCRVVLASVLFAAAPAVSRAQSGCVDYGSHIRTLGGTHMQNRCLLEKEQS